MVLYRQGLSLRYSLDRCREGCLTLFRDEAEAGNLLTAGVC